MSARCRLLSLAAILGMAMLTACEWLGQDADTGLSGDDGRWTGDLPGPGDDLPGDAAGPGDEGIPPDPAVPGDPGTGGPDVSEDPGGPGPGPGPFLLIATQDDLEAAALEWQAYRQAQGMEVEVGTVEDLAPGAVQASDYRDGVLRRLREARDRRGADRLFLLILGDAPAGGRVEGGRWPAQRCTNSTPGASGCWTDNRYGDLDGDGEPEVAVGRVPARTLEEARQVLRKVQVFEGTYRTGLFNRRLGLYVGEAGFGEAIDGLLELAMMEGLKRVDHAFDILGAWDNPSSAYWYLPFTDKVVDLFSDGALATVYIGHGSEEWTQGLTAEEVSAIDCSGTRCPFSFFFACYAGNYSGSSDSLAERLAFKEDGPVVAFGASDVSHPYGNAVLAYETQRLVLEMRHETIGEVLVAIKEALAGNLDDEFRQFIDGGATVDPSCDTPAKQQRLLVEHMDLYNLLGDPATRLQYPRAIASIRVESGGIRSGPIEVRGQAPGVRTGQAYLTLETERDEIWRPLLPVDPDDPDAEAVRANWQAANDKVLSAATVGVADGAFQGTLEVPPGAPGGDLYLKVYAWDDAGNDALGVIDAPR
ncbi:hypothetical protein KBD49_12520 [Myxococcota bacterium]|nr:hypothetical protein [Myxococcota bacterium]